MLFDIIGKKSPNCVRFSMAVVTFAHACFRCRVIVPLCGFIKDIMLHMLHGKIFVIESRFVSSNVISPLMQFEHCVVLLARKFECRNIDDTSGEILWRREFQFYTNNHVLLGIILTILGQKAAALSIRICQKVSEPCAYLSSKSADLEWQFDAAQALGFCSNWIENWQPNPKLQLICFCLLFLTFKVYLARVCKSIGLIYFSPHFLQFNLPSPPQVARDASFRVYSRCLSYFGWDFKIFVVFEYV